MISKLAAARIACACLIVGANAGLAIGVMNAHRLGNLEVFKASGWVLLAIGFLWAITDDRSDDRRGDR
jgi:hypothetical protein